MCVFSRLLAIANRWKSGTRHGSGGRILNVWNWVHDHYGNIILALTLIGVVLAWLQYRKREHASSSSRLSLKDSPVGERSTVISGSHNQVVIGHPSLTPATSNPPKTERPAPNLVYAGGKRKSVFISPSQYEGICDPKIDEQWNRSVEAFVLKFENMKPKGDRKIGRALNVIAKLKFRHKNGARERDIDYGVWLNSPCNSTEIGIGDTEELVLMCVLDNKLVTFEDRRSGNRFFEGFTYIHDGDVEDYELIDIALIDQNSQANLSMTLRVWREGGNFFSQRL
jgi:hypothetical protein